MKKSFLFTLLAVATLLVTALGMQASPAAPNKNADKRVKLAREKYPQRLEAISSVKQYEKDEIPNVNYLTAVRQQNWAGSGQSKDKTEYYYTEIEKEEIDAAFAAAKKNIILFKKAFQAMYGVTYY